MCAWNVRLIGNLQQMREVIAVKQIGAEEILGNEATYTAQKRISPDKLTSHIDLVIYQVCFNLDQFIHLPISKRVPRIEMKVTR